VEKEIEIAEMAIEIDVGGLDLKEAKNIDWRGFRGFSSQSPNTSNIAQKAGGGTLEAL